MLVYNLDQEICMMFENFFDIYFKEIDLLLQLFLLNHELYAEKY